jgi:hypothetical protein
MPNDGTAASPSADGKVQSINIIGSDRVPIGAAG